MNSAGVGSRSGAGKAVFLALVAALALTAVAGVFHLDTGVASAAKAKIKWESCGFGTAPRAKCGRLLVPQDYSKPRGKKFALAMVKVPATGRKRGSLFFNPGGPGGSGLEFVLLGGTESLPRSIKQNFDFISWDPRGVGLTRPAIRGCKAFPVSVNVLPDTGTASDAQWLELLSSTRETNRKEARQCLGLKRNRGFIRHMGTRNVVRDLDRMRAAVGDQKLTFWGGSYGTRIGYTYALTYPQRLRAILLDGSVNPVGGFRQFGRVRAQATNRALEVIRRVRPAFGDRIIATRDDLRINGPVEIEDQGQVARVTQWDFENFVAMFTFAQAQWTDIQEAMDAIRDARSGNREQRRRAGTKLSEVLEMLKDRPYSPEVGFFVPAEDEAMMLRVINHLDYADSTIPPEVGQRMMLENTGDYPFASGPTTAFFATASEGIQFLKPTPVPQTGNQKNARRAAALKEILITGSTGDGATPFVWTEQMASAFEKAALIRYNGWQHVNWMSLESGCVNNPITNFILTGKKPSPLRPPLCPFALPGPPAVPVG